MEALVILTAVIAYIVIRNYAKRFITTKADLVLSALSFLGFTMLVIYQLVTHFTYGVLIVGSIFLLAFFFNLYKKYKAFSTAV